MQSAIPSISAFCRAENSLKHIDKETKFERGELFDCTKTLKELIKQEMINKNIESIEVEVDGKPQYLRFQVPQPSKKLSKEDILKASENITEVFQAQGYIPDVLVKLITDRLKESQLKTIGANKKVLVMSKSKGKEEVARSLENTPKETNKLVTDFLDVNTRLTKIRKKTKESKKEHVDIKKRMNEDVCEALKHTDSMTQQIQMVDPRSGLRQSMVLKANVEKKQQVLGIRTIAPFIREAAVRSLEKIKTLTHEEFEEEFRDELMSLIDERPSKDKTTIKFSKKSSVE